MDSKTLNLETRLAAKRLITVYVHNPHLLLPEEFSLLHDLAAEHGQLLDNVINTSWFGKLLVEKIGATYYG